METVVFFFLFVFVFVFACSGAVGPQFLGCSLERFGEDDVNCISAARLSSSVLPFFLISTKEMIDEALVHQKQIPECSLGGRSS